MRPARLLRFALAVVPIGVASLTPGRALAAASAPSLPSRPLRAGEVVVVRWAELPRGTEELEKLQAQALELSTSELGVADDSRDEHAWSGDLAVLGRLVRDGGPWLETVNVYGSWRTSFKPAAPNLTEPEGARILDTRFERR